MKQMFLILALVTSGNCILVLVNTVPRSIAMRASSKSNQDEPPLKLDQIEDFIKNETPDTAIAAKVKQRGISFELTECHLQKLRELARLHKRGAEIGATIQALREKKSELKFEEPVPSACPSDSDTSRYGFEKEGEILWKKQKEDEKSRAVIDLKQSPKGIARAGCHSLRLIVDLVGEHPNNSKGEAYVNLSDPIDLENVDISVRVRYPKAAVGNPSFPNGAQVFVKDKNYNGEYGTWLAFDEDLAGKWVELKLKPSKNGADVGFMKPGFDPTKIMMVGIQIAAGGGSTACYSGPIYIDAINWQEKAGKPEGK